MKLAFYYHVPVSNSPKGAFLPEYLARFIEGLNDQVDQLYFIAHTVEGEGETRLSDDIQIIDLGKKTNSLHRSFFSKNILQPVLKYIDNIDAFLVRAPSPLAPYFKTYRSMGKSVTYYLVGDYLEGANQIRINSLRDLAIKFYLKWNHKQLMKAVRGQSTIVNSKKLQEDLKGVSDTVRLIPTTTLSDDDFYQRSQPFSAPYKILYTGRLDFQKGLSELVEAMGQLVLQGIDVQLHLVGWEEGVKIVQTQLSQRAEELNISNRIFFHGKKKVGEELNELYRMADIYCIPSYHEGFPRTIWEAGANQLPVIATAVGGIPHVLESEKNALLIPPKDINSITETIHKVIENTELREHLVDSLFELAKKNTIQKRSKEIISVLGKSND